MQHHKIPILIVITQCNNLLTMSDVTEVISLCIHVRVQRYGGVYIVAYTVHIPPSRDRTTQFTYRRGPTTQYKVPSAHARVMEIVCRGRVGTIVVITRPPTQVSCVCVCLLYSTTDVVYNIIYNIILYCLHVGGYMWHCHIKHVLYTGWKNNEISSRLRRRLGAKTIQRTPKCLNIL